MTDYCKLFLVPESVVRGWESDRKNKRVDDPLLAQQQESREIMSESLLKQGLSEADKIQLLTQSLGDYLQAIKSRKRSLKAPPTPNPTTPLARTSDPRTPLDPPRVTQTSTIPRPEEARGETSALLERFPASVKGKAENLMAYLDRIPSFSHDERMNVYLDRDRIPGSNLIDYLMFSTGRGRKEPKNISQFVKFLQRENIPVSLTPNPALLALRERTPAVSNRMS